MNTAKTPPYLTPKAQPRLQLGPLDNLAQDGYPSGSKSGNTPPPHVSHLTEWISLSSSEDSMQDEPQDQFLRVEIPQIIRGEDPDFDLEDKDDDMDLSPGKKENKYLKRRLKNEKNYRDLNKSLANLAMKRANRSSSSDNNTLLYNSQNQTQADKSYNFEFQPFLYSPGNGGKNFSTTTNPSNMGPNGSSGFLSKNYSGSPHVSAQGSPVKVEESIPKSCHSPEKLQPYAKVEVKKFEADHMKMRSVTPNIGYPTTRVNYYNAQEKSVVNRRIESDKEQKSLNHSHWANSNVKFFPGDMEKIMTLQTEARKDDRTKIFNEQKESTSRQKSPVFLNEKSQQKQEASPTFAFSFKDPVGTKDKKKVLDSRLPSKIELNERHHTHETDDGFGYHEKSAFEGYSNRGMMRDESISMGVKYMQGGVGVTSRSKLQEETKLEPAERKAIEEWKNELLKIKYDMEERKKSYKEVNNFVQMCEGKEKVARFGGEGVSSTRSKTSNQEHRMSSIASSSSGSKFEPHESRSFNMLNSSSSKNNLRTQTQNDNEVYRISFGIKTEEDLGLYTKSPEKRPQQNEERSPDFRNRGTVTSSFDLNPNNKSNQASGSVKKPVDGKGRTTVSDSH